MAFGYWDYLTNNLLLPVFGLVFIAVPVVRLVIRVLEQYATGMWHLIVRVPERQKSRYPMGICFFGGSSGTRTLDPRLKRALLYQLS